MLGSLPDHSPTDTQIVIAAAAATINKKLSYRLETGRQQRISL